MIAAALGIYLLVVIIVLFLARLAGIRMFSALVLALFLGFLVFILVRPLSKVKKDGHGPTHEVLVHLVLFVITIFIILVYLLWKIFTDLDYRYLPLRVVREPITI